MAAESRTTGEVLDSDVVTALGFQPTGDSPETIEAKHLDSRVESADVAPMTDLGADHGESIAGLENGAGPQVAESPAASNGKAEAAEPIPLATALADFFTPKSSANGTSEHDVTENTAGETDRTRSAVLTDVTPVERDAESEPQAEAEAPVVEESGPTETTVEAEQHSTPTPERSELSPGPGDVNDGPAGGSQAMATAEVDEPQEMPVFEVDEPAVVAAVEERDPQWAPSGVPDEPDDESSENAALRSVDNEPDQHQDQPSEATTSDIDADTDEPSSRFSTSVDTGGSQTGSGKPSSEEQVAREAEGETMTVLEQGDLETDGRRAAAADPGLFDVDTGLDLTSDSPSIVPQPVEPAPAAVGTSSRRRTKLRSRKVRRVIRHVDPWSVLVMSVLFHLVMFTASLLAGSIVWSIAIEAGTISNIEAFIAELGDYPSFRIDGEAVFRAAVMLAAVVTLASSVMVVLMAVVFNLLSDLIGGIRVTVVEEETVRLPRK